MNEAQKDMEDLQKVDKWFTGGSNWAIAKTVFFLGVRSGGCGVLGDLVEIAC